MEVLMQNKQEKTVISSKRELASYVFQMLTETESKTEMSEDEKRRMEARIIAKLKAGKKLTGEEMDFLRRYNTELYLTAVRVQQMAEGLKEQLKRAKSKEEADAIVSTAYSSISDKDPAKEYLTAAVSNVSTEFRRSGAYNRLPNTIDEVEKAKKKQTKNPFKESDEKDMDTEDDFDLTGWSPLQEVLDAMPTFSAEA